MRNIIVDADGEVILRLAFLEFFEDGLDHGRGKFLGGQAVASADDRRDGLERGIALGQAFSDGGDHILVQRFASDAGFLGAVEHGDLLDRGGQCLEQMFHREWAVETNLDHADLLHPCCSGSRAVSSAVSAPEPMTTMTFSASGAPT